MNKKWPLIAGIIMLTAGIILRKTTDLGMGAVAIIITGVLLKVYYIIGKIRSGEYSPGYEMAFLFVGLGMFLTGLYFKNTGSDFNSALLMVPGVTLKIVFVLVFIRKSRKMKPVTE